MATIIKYPRTYHIEGSRFQPGDEDLDSVPFSAISDQYVVIEEKVDGANAAISFSPAGKMLLQSRGHYLTGEPREKHFVYLEVPFEEILRPNRSRIAMIPEFVIHKLVRKLEIPELTEAHEVQWIINI